MKEQIKTDKAPAAIGPYSQAVKSNGFVFCSGQLAINPETGKVEGDVQEQTKTLLTNMGNILAEAGSSLDKVVKTTVFLADIKDFAAVNEVYATFFKDIPPARSAFQVANLPLGGLIEVEAIAEA